MKLNEFLEQKDKLANEWLNYKKTRMKNLLNIAFPDEALYREILVSLGYPNNKNNFLNLALIFPFKMLKDFENREQIKEAMLYRAGFLDKPSIVLPTNFDFSLKMNKSVWNLTKIRPANFPNKRIENISFLLYQTKTTGLVNFFQTKIQKLKLEEISRKTSKKIVQGIMDFKGIGIQRKQEMFFNIIFPFLLVYDNSLSEILLKIFNTHPPLAKNKLIKKFENQFNIENGFTSVLTNTKDYFAAIYFMKNNN